MLKNTFLHIPGVGKRTEEKLWENKVIFWEDFFQNQRKIPLPKNLLKRIEKHLLLSLKALKEKDILFFYKSLPSTDYWRIYPEFKTEAVFLDIETTGLSPYQSEITVVGVYNGDTYCSFVRGINLEKFKEEIKKYRLVITYGGSRFDIPFLKFNLKGISLPPVHIDLLYLLRGLGYRGGLKRIESQLGIQRAEEVKNLNGYDAVLLWYKYLRGRKDSLKLLLRYNQEDCKNLKSLIEFSVEEKRKLHFPGG